MSKIIRIGMDTSKRVFQLHGVDENEMPVLRRKLRRRLGELAVHSAAKARFAGGRLGFG